MCQMYYRKFKVKIPLISLLHRVKIDLVILYPRLECSV